MTSPPAHAKAWTIGLSTLASFVTGIALAVHGDQIDQAGHQGAGWMAWGVILILTPLLIAGGAFVLWLIGEASKEARKYSAWKQTLTPEQQLGVKVAETAALYAAWAGVHHSVVAGREREAVRVEHRKEDRARQAHIRQNLAGMNQKLWDENFYGQR